MGRKNSISRNAVFSKAQFISRFFLCFKTLKRKSLAAGFFCLLNTTTQAQFFNGYGLSAGVLYGTHRNVLDLEPVFRKNMKWRWGWHIAAFAEYGSGEYLRLQTEIQWFRSGAYSTLWHTPVPTRHGVLGQYLKARQELYDITPYALIGPRLEYLFSAAYPGFLLTHFGAYAALGVEFLYWRPLIPFIEIGRTQDITPTFHTDPLRVYSRTWLARIGIKREIKKRSAACRTGGFRPAFE